MNAREEIPDFKSFEQAYCDTCNFDGYCVGKCESLFKATKIPFEKLQACYERNDGDMSKVHRYIKRYVLD